MKEKSCFPEGCIYFRWKCRQLNKKNSCHRGYSHVGRKCYGCRDFYEEKIHNYPELQISEEEYAAFLKEFEEFEDWLAEKEYKQIEFAGTVRAVKPHFVQKVFPKTSFLSFRGYIVVLDNAFTDREHFEDPLYMLLSQRYYQDLRIGAGARIEGFAHIKADHGRIILYRSRGIEVLSCGGEPAWNDQSIQMARETATEFSEHPEKCVQCEFGALVDVDYQKDHHTSARRKLFCLKGISDYRDCYVRAEYCGLDHEADASPGPTCEQRRKIIVP
ncbi:MAG: hypothetical protein JXL67_04710 [Calditrichaeota bacterium]|nr:hypothetical protein [Calditrichota bacterium]